ncbi:MAG: universal stress protein [Cyanobacteria bacterium J06621_11]
MYKKILVGIDDGETANTVFQKAVSLAQSTDAELLLLSVLVPPDRLHPAVSASMNGNVGSGNVGSGNVEESDSPVDADESVWSVYQSLYKDYELRDLERLESFADSAKAAGITAQISQRFGRPGWEICDRAKNCEADLVIVGSHGRMGLSEMLLGSVSNYVMHHATCSVLVVHDRPQNAYEVSQSESQQELHQQELHQQELHQWAFEN